MKPYNFSIGDIMAIAERKMPEGWSAFRWEKATNGSMVTGSIPDGVYSRGPKKGRPRRTGKGDVVVVSQPDMDAAATAYELETGDCWDCKGTGRVLTGFSKANGNTYRACARCEGSGKVQVNA